MNKGPSELHEEIRKRMRAGKSYRQAVFEVAALLAVAALTLSLIIGFLAGALVFIVLTIGWPIVIPLVLFAIVYLLAVYAVLRATRDLGEEAE